MAELKLDIHKLKNFPGVDLAFGWINAAHDYDCILEIEGLLRKQKIQDEDLQLPENYSFYCEAHRCGAGSTTSLQPSWLRRILAVPAVPLPLLPSNCEAHRCGAGQYQIRS